MCGYDRNVMIWFRFGVMHFGCFRYTLFFDKKHFYNTVEAEIDADVKNMLRTYPT